MLGTWRREASRNEIKDDEPCTRKADFRQRTDYSRPPGTDFGVPEGGSGDGEAELPLNAALLLPGSGQIALKRLVLLRQDIDLGLAGNDALLAVVHAREHDGFLLIQAIDLISEVAVFAAALVHLARCVRYCCRSLLHLALRHRRKGKYQHAPRTV